MSNTVNKLLKESKREGDLILIDVFYRALFSVNYFNLDKIGRHDYDM